MACHQFAHDSGGLFSRLNQTLLTRWLDRQTNLTATGKYVLTFIFEFQRAYVDNFPCFNLEPCIRAVEGRSSNYRTNDVLTLDPANDVLARTQALRPVALGRSKHFVHALYGQGRCTVFAFNYLAYADLRSKALILALDNDRSNEYQPCAFTPFGRRLCKQFHSLFIGR